MPGSAAPRRKTRNFKGLLLKDTTASNAEQVSPLDESGRSFTRMMRPLEESRDSSAYDSLAGVALGPRAATRLELPDWFSPRLRQPNTTPPYAGAPEQAYGIPTSAAGLSSEAQGELDLSAAPTTKGHKELSQQLNGMRLNDNEASERLELKNSNLRTICELGSGNGGTVSKVEHIPTGIVMAKKVRRVPC